MPVFWGMPCFPPLLSRIRIVAKELEIKIVRPLVLGFLLKDLEVWK
jgi:hypothetical protein